jgi:hypothetical protein
MSGYAQRETILRADAMQWRERVRADMTSAAGRAALIEHRISAEAVAAAADRIARMSQPARFLSKCVPVGRGVPLNFLKRGA